MGIALVWSKQAGRGVRRQSFFPGESLNHAQSPCLSAWVDWAGQSAYPAPGRHPPLLARPPACSVTAPRLRASNKRVILGKAREKRSP